MQQHVEDVGDVHDAGGERDRLAGEAVGIAAAVPPLVVAAHDPLGDLEDLRAAALEDPRAEHGVRLDHRQLLRRPAAPA